MKNNKHKNSIYARLRYGLFKLFKSYLTKNRISITFGRWQSLTAQWLHGLYQTQTIARPKTAPFHSLVSSEQEFSTYLEELQSGQSAIYLEQAQEDYERAWDQEFRFDSRRYYYPLIRALEPSTVVETGISNGISTLFILLALQENGHGDLYSIDYPYYVDESLDEFQDETFEGYGGAAIPSNKEPGWIVPNELKDGWTLLEGKSQRMLPKLASDVEQFDLFIHDSEHSLPCMMFEYELAWEHLNEGGMILSDDVDWNSAFNTFNQIRDPTTWGRVGTNTGYIIK